MDGFTFTAEIIKALAWPSAVVVLFVLLRKPVIGLVPLMRKLKYKELELEFSSKVQELKSEVPIDLAERKTKSEVSDDSVEEKTKSETPSHLIEKKIPKRSHFQPAKALDLVSYSTRAAIIEAWIELEAAAVEVASSFWGQGSSEVFKNVAGLGKYLHKCKVLDDRQLRIFNRLRALRNMSAHAEELQLSEDDARTYVEMASLLTGHIKKFE